MDKAPNRIRHLRHEAQISQQVLADAIHVSKMTISDLERGEVALTLDYMRRIAKVFGIAPDEVLNEGDHGLWLDAQEQALIHHFRSADPIQRAMIERIAAPVDQAEKKTG